MVPIVSSSPSNMTPSFSAGLPRYSPGSMRAPDPNRFSRLQRPILPKPSNIPNNLIDQQNSVIGEGRQGPILDVKSIIADYRYGTLCFKCSEVFTEIYVLSEKCCVGK